MQFHFGARRIEDFPGEVVPRATAFRGGMVKSVGIATAQPNDLLRELRGGCRRNHLAVHNTNFASLSRQLQHQLYKVEAALGAARAFSVKAGGADNEMFGSRRANKLLSG